MYPRNATPNAAKEPRLWSLKGKWGGLFEFRFEAGIVGVEVGDEVFYGFEITVFDDAGVVVSTWEGLPDLGGGLAEFEEPAHVCRSGVYWLARRLIRGS